VLTRVPTASVYKRNKKNREVDGSVAGPTLLLEEIDDSLFCFASNDHNKFKKKNSHAI
jgi:hypothetical protein